MSRRAPANEQSGKPQESDDSKASQRHTTPALSPQNLSACHQDFLAPRRLLVIQQFFDQSSLFRDHNFFKFSFTLPLSPTAREDPRISDLSFARALSKRLDTALRVAFNRSAISLWLRPSK